MLPGPSIVPLTFIFVGLLIQRLGQLDLPVDVVFPVGRQVVVDDERDLLHVNAASL